MEKLNPQQNLFIKLYTTQGETFGNGMLSYARAYDFDLPLDKDNQIIISSSEYNTCKVNASKLLTDANILACKVQLLKEMFDNSDIIDARTQEIVLSGKDADSIQAIKIHNDLKQRITKKLDITTGGRPLLGLTDDELEDLTK